MVSACSCIKPSPGFERWFGPTPSRRRRNPCRPCSTGMTACSPRPHRLHRHGQDPQPPRCSPPRACPVWDADAAVHRLYAPNRRRLCPAIAALSPAGQSTPKASTRAAKLKDPGSPPIPQRWLNSNAGRRPPARRRRPRRLSSPERQQPTSFVLDIPLLFREPEP